ncbi:unnamed protein product [Parajaminaea phylloscopi]
MAQGPQNGAKKGGRDSDQATTHQVDSIRKATRLPTALQQSAPLQGARPPKSLSGVADKKLRANLGREVLSQRRARDHAAQADQFLHQGAPGEEAGLIETEGELERTARLTQREIKDAIGVEAATKSFSLDLSGGRGGVGLGPYRSSYTPNGRQLLLAGRSGHLATFDWQSGKLGCEIQVKETVRDATWLHNASFFAAAQKKHVFIYDGEGAEVHRLKDHVDVHRLEFLRYHFLLVSIGSAGYLKYHDTSTGNLISQHRTRLGACSTMAQNPATAVIHLGHSNGTVSLWTPNLPQAAMSVQCHRGPVSAVSIDPRDGAREMATAGLEGAIKVWDCRMLGKGPVREWSSRKPATDLKYSQKGLLAASWGSHVSIYDTKTPRNSRAPPGPYLTNNFPKSEPISISFCPFEDVLGVGHSRGFDSLVVPGAGEPRFDSTELDPFEGKTARREREVRNLLDKIQPDMISIDPSFLGQLDAGASRNDVERSESATLAKAAANGTPYARLSRLDRLRLEGKADEGDDAAFVGDDQDDESGRGDQSGRTAAVVAVGNEPKEKKRARGKNSAMKRYLRKKRVNVVDQNTIQIQAKLARSREAHAANKERKDRAAQGLDPSAAPKESSALDVFAPREMRRRR